MAAGSPGLHGHNVEFLPLNYSPFVGSKHVFYFVIRIHFLVQLLFFLFPKCKMDYVSIDMVQLMVPSILKTKQAWKMKRTTQQM